MSEQNIKERIYDLFLKYKAEKAAILIKRPDLHHFSDFSDDGIKLRMIREFTSDLTKLYYTENNPKPTSNINRGCKDPVISKLESIGYSAEELKASPLLKDYQRALEVVGFGITASEFARRLDEFKKAIHINLVAMPKANYKSKDGRIKRGIEIFGKYYAPKNDI